MAVHTPLVLKPRLKTSKKWTQLPSELLTQIVSVCRANFVEHAKKGDFLATGHIYSEEILFQLGFLEKERLKQINFNVSIQFDPKKDNALNMIHLALDCAGSLMATHFEEGGEDKPTEWEKIMVEGKAVYHCLTTENSKLEEEANKWLGKLSKDLVAEDDSLDDLDEDFDDEIADEVEEKAKPSKPTTKRRPGGGSSDPIH